MTAFSEAVTDVLREEVAAATLRAVGDQLAVGHTTLWYWLQGHPGKADVIDATVERFGIERIVRAFRIRERGACVECGQRPRKRRFRRCWTCLQTGSSAQAGMAVPS